MKYLITGGAGFIGGALVRHLLEETSHNVLNIDKLTYAGNLESISSVVDSERYSFQKIDICDQQSTHKAMRDFEPDYIVHLAAESHVDRSISDPLEFLNTNIMGTYSLLESSIKYFEKLNQEKQDNFKFLHVSTDEVYGDLESSLDLFQETTPYNPSSPYSASKASSDHLVRAWQRTYGLPTLITNCSNNYGPYQFPEKLIPHMILSAIELKPLPVYGEGTQIRDWLFVNDHVKALIKVAEEGRIGETYNIGGNNEKKNIEVIEGICDLIQEIYNPANKKRIKSYKDLITFVDDRPGHDLRYAIDSSKIHRELDWKPEESFETGLEKTVRWYLDNKNWWKRIISGEYQLKRIGERQ